MKILPKKIALVMCLVLMIPLVQAFGVTSSYWDTNPLTLHAGEEKVVELELQNMVGGEDLTLLAKITEGADIATILGESTKFIVPFGSKDVRAKILIKLPADVFPGETRDVAVSFTQVTDQDEGKMIQMVSGVGKKIPVVVVSNQPEEVSGKLFSGEGPLSLSTILIIALVVLIVALLGFLLVRKRS